MRDVKADPAKQTAECIAADTLGCANKQSRDTWDTETVWCDVCGLYYKLHDDDMR